MHWNQRPSVQNKVNVKPPVILRDQLEGSYLIFFPCSALDSHRLGMAECISGRREKIIQMLVKNLVSTTGRYSSCAPAALLKGEVLPLAHPAPSPLLCPSVVMQGGGNCHVPRVPPRVSGCPPVGVSWAAVHNSTHWSCCLLQEQQAGED